VAGWSRCSKVEFWAARSKTSYSLTLQPLTLDWKPWRREHARWFPEIQPFLELRHKPLAQRWQSTSVEINVLAGWAAQMAADNKSLGGFILDGIPPAAKRCATSWSVFWTLMPRGCCQLRLKTKLERLQSHQKSTGSTGLFQRRKWKKMTKEAECAMRPKTAEKKGQIRMPRNAADSLIFTAGKGRQESWRQAPAEIKKKLKDRLQLWKAFWTLVQRPIWS